MEAGRVRRADGPNTTGRLVPLQAASDPKQVLAHMARAPLGFNEQLECIGEAAVAVAPGASLSTAISGRGTAAGALAAARDSFCRRRGWAYLVRVPNMRERASRAWFGIPRRCFDRRSDVCRNDMELPS